MVVERARVKTQVYHEGSYDLARRKHFTQFLANKLTRIAQVHAGRPKEIRVYLDKLPSSYANGGKAKPGISGGGDRKFTIGELGS
jgi:hypothetical protein